MSKQETLYECKEDGFFEREFKACMELVRNWNYVCRSCGWVVPKMKYVCKPVEL